MWINEIKAKKIMKNKTKHYYPVSYRIRARTLANRLGEKNWERLLDIVTDVPRPLIFLALRQTEKAKPREILFRSKADVFISKLKSYSKQFGIKYPDHD